MVSTEDTTMFGFVIGTVCLIALVKVVRGGRRWGHWGGHHGRGGWGRRAYLNRLFARLETSPSQEKVIVGAIDEVRGTARGLRPELDATRADIAKLLADEQFDAERLGALFARHDEALRQMREAITGSLSKVHGALDGHQRQELARLLEARFGWGGGGHRGPYREVAI